MAHQQVEGSETGGATAPAIDVTSIDINEWLKSNRLSKLKDYFETEEAVMEDLLAFTEMDIQLSPWRIWEFNQAFHRMDK